MSSIHGAFAGLDGDGSATCLDRLECPRSRCPSLFGDDRRVRRRRAQDSSTETSPTSTGRPTAQSSASSHPTTCSGASTRSPVVLAPAQPCGSPPPHHGRGGGEPLPRTRCSMPRPTRTRPEPPGLRSISSGPQHPVLDWLADKVLYRVERNRGDRHPVQRRGADRADVGRVVEQARRADRRRPGWPPPSRTDS